MDNKLRERLSDWERQIDLLCGVEKTFLQLEASESPLFGSLYLNEIGAVKERESKVYASEDWRQFSMGLVEAKSRYLHEKRRLEVLQKAFDAEYLSTKLDNDFIKRS